MVQASEGSRRVLAQMDLFRKRGDTHRRGEREAEESREGERNLRGRIRERLNYTKEKEKLLKKSCVRLKECF